MSLARVQLCEQGSVGLEGAVVGATLHHAKGRCAMWAMFGYAIRKRWHERRRWARQGARHMPKGHACGTCVECAAGETVMHG